MLKPILNAQPSARYLAQMRGLLSSSAKVPDVVTAAFIDGAFRRGLTVAMAQKMAPGLEKLVEHSRNFKIETEKQLELLEQFLTEATGGAGEEEPEALAGTLIMTYISARDGSQPIWRGEVGDSWDSPRGVAMKAGSALAMHLAHRMGIKREAGMGREMASLSLADMAMQCARAAGLRPFNGAEAIRMAAGHTGSDFGYAIGQGLSGVVAQGFELARPAIAEAARAVQAVDYRPRNSVRLSASAMPSLIAEGGEVKQVTINEKGELAAKPDDYAAMFAVSNQALQNDSTAMNLLADIGAKMAQGSVARFRAVLLAPLLANAGLGQNMTDGLALFHASHGNLAASGTALTVASLSAARTAMRRQVDGVGTILALEPAALLVAPEKETEAQQLVAQLMATKTADVNPFQNGLTIITEPGLTNATAWYLLADPARSQGLTYAYLEGQASPRVETREGWNTLGMEFRLVWAIGAAFIETASWYRNAGA